MYKIYPLKIMESIEPEPRIFYLGDCAKTIQLSTYFWLVKGQGKTILIDTGVGLADGLKINPGMKQADSDHPLKQLQNKNIRPEDVTDIIITHVHWDHLSPVIDKFISAKIYVQKKDVDYALNPPHPWFSKFIFLDMLKKFSSVGYRLRVELVEGEKNILPGIAVFLIGGHTPGSQAVKIQTGKGTVILPGDTIFTYRNVEQDIPDGFNSSLEECYLAMQRVRKEADIILPNHDPEVVNRYGWEIG